MDITGIDFESLHGCSHADTYRLDIYSMIMLVSAEKKFLPAV